LATAVNQQRPLTSILRSFLQWESIPTKKKQVLYTEAQLAALTDVLAHVGTYAKAEIEAVHKVKITSDLLRTEDRPHLTEYQGWSNYPTAMVFLHCKNDRDFCRTMKQRAEAAYLAFTGNPTEDKPGDYETMQTAGISILAHNLRNLFEKWNAPTDPLGIGTHEGTFAAFAYSFVNWHEIAEHLLNEYHEKGKHGGLANWLNTSDK